MLEKLKKLSNRYDEISHLLSAPHILNDQVKYQELVKELSKLTEINNIYKSLLLFNQQLEENKSLIKSENDNELKELITEDIASLENKISKLNKQAEILLIPKDIRDEGSAIIEIRAGAGGDEAGLFVADLTRLYRRFAEKNGFKVNMIDSSSGLGNGFKEIVFEIEGEGAYRQFKYEGGTHRVQRVPETEAQGRVHTSTVTVAVLPEKTEIEEIKINPTELKIDTYRSQGAGGQHVNTTDSAVRITHLTSGIVVACQEERSQIKNRHKALQYLKVKLNEQEINKRQQAESSLRRQMVGTGDRSEKIRTYNYPQGRLSDHRAKITLYRLDEIMQSGDISEIVNALLVQEQLMKLQKIT